MTNDDYSSYPDYRSAASAVLPDQAGWHRSSHCGPDGGNCVAVRFDAGHVRVRDTKAVDRSTLVLVPGAWRGLLAEVRSGRLDAPG